MTGDSIRVSVIVPVYNTVPAYLSQCIEGVLRQSVPPSELLLIDDCSTNEETLALLASYAQQEDGAVRIRLLRNEKNGGISASRNRGIREACGNWIIFLDHDDYWQPAYLEELTACAAAHADADLVVSGYTMVAADGSPLYTYPAVDEREDSPYFPFGSSAPWNRLILRQKLLDNAICFPSGCLAEDLVFNMRCSLSFSGIYALRASGYCNRANDGSTSRGSAFARMPYAKMPFADLEDICAQAASGAADTEALSGAVLNILVLLSCVFCRKSPRQDKRRAAAAASAIGRRYIRHPLRIILKYLENVRSGKALCILDTLFACALHLRLSYPYCLCMSALISVLKK